MITGKTGRGIISLALLAVISFWIGREQGTDVAAPVTGLDPRLNYVLREFDLQIFDESGRPAFSLRAPVLRNDPALKLGTIERPVISILDQGAIWDVTADNATMTADRKHVHLWGGVLVKWRNSASGKRSEFQTDEIEMEITLRTASTDQEVSLSDGRNHINAIGMNLDMKKGSYTLKQRVQGTYAVN